MVLTIIYDGLSICTVAHTITFKYTYYFRLGNKCHWFVWSVILIKMMLITV